MMNPPPLNHMGPPHPGEFSPRGVHPNDRFPNQLPNARSGEQFEFDNRANRTWNHNASNNSTDRDIPVEPEFKGFILQPGNPNDGDKVSWKYTRRQNLPLGNAKLLEYVEQSKAKRTTIKMIDLSPIQIDVINRLVDDENQIERNRNAQWVVANICRYQDRAGRRSTNTTSKLRVIIKRIDRASGMSSQGRYDSNSDRDFIDLSMPSRNSSGGESPRSNDSRRGRYDSQSENDDDDRRDSRYENTRRHPNAHYDMDPRARASMRPHSPMGFERPPPPGPPHLNGPYHDGPLPHPSMGPHPGPPQNAGPFPPDMIPGGPMPPFGVPGPFGPPDFGGPMPMQQPPFHGPPLPMPPSQANGPPLPMPPPQVNGPPLPLQPQFQGPPPGAHFPDQPPMNNQIPQPNPFDPNFDPNTSRHQDFPPPIMPFNGPNQSAHSKNGPGHMHQGNPSPPQSRDKGPSQDEADHLRRLVENVRDRVEEVEDGFDALRLAGDVSPVSSSSSQKYRRRDSTSSGGQWSPQRENAIYTPSSTPPTSHGSYSPRSSPRNKKLSRTISGSSKGSDDYYPPPLLQNLPLDRGRAHYHRDMSFDDRSRSRSGAAVAEYHRHHHRHGRDSSRTRGRDYTSSFSRDRDSRSRSRVQRRNSSGSSSDESSRSRYKGYENRPRHLHSGSGSSRVHFPHRPSVHYPDDQPDAHHRRRREREKYSDYDYRRGDSRRRRSSWGMEDEREGYYRH